MAFSDRMVCDESIDGRARIRRYDGITKIDCFTLHESINQLQ